MVVEDLVESGADGGAIEVAGAADFGDELEAAEDGELEKERCADAFVEETAHTEGVEQTGFVGIDACVVIVCIEITYVDGESSSFDGFVFGFWVNPMGRELPVEALPHSIAKTVALGVVADHRCEQEGFQLDAFGDVDLVLDAKALRGVVAQLLVSVFRVFACPRQVFLLGLHSVANGE